MAHRACVPWKHVGTCGNLRSVRRKHRREVLTKTKCIFTQAGPPVDEPVLCDWLNESPTHTKAERKYVSTERTKHAHENTCKINKKRSVIIKNKNNFTCEI